MKDIRMIKRGSDSIPSPFFVNNEYNQIEETKYNEKGCPNCGSQNHWFMGIDSCGGIGTGRVVECSCCEWHMSIVCDYDLW